MKYFSASREWIEVADGVGAVGLAQGAIDAIGDVVFVSLPTIGTTIKGGDPAVVSESSKAAIDVYSPVSGTVVAVNDSVRDNPSLLGRGAEGAGWLFKVALCDPAELTACLP